MIRRLALAMTLCLAVLMVPASAYSQPRTGMGVDCTEAPAPDMPGQGLSAFFQRTPDPLPGQEDPFARNSRTTIYEQYGYAGLRWSNYDLGCGSDAARHPDAVVGTAMSNWILNLPISLTALTSSISEVAFAPSYLDVFDPIIHRVSDALYRKLFAGWAPAAIALLGIAILVMARRAALATTAASIGWALMVILVATAIFKWPIYAGHFADATVTKTLGAVVEDLNRGQESNPGVTVASKVQESILYESWLAGELGSSSSKTARKYGSELFRAQALTWREADIVQGDPKRGRQIIEQKQARFKQIAAQIEENDPTAYEHLTGKRSDTRVGYAFLSAVGALTALPFVLVAALLLMGSFMIVRLAVMLFPAFATIGLFPASRGVVIGIGRTVGAALVNAVVFGIGAAVTIRVLGLILDPASRIPGWLAYVLMPLFGFIMWVALKPFRRLTTMVSRGRDSRHDAAGAAGNPSGTAPRVRKRASAAAVASDAGGVTGAVTAHALDSDQGERVPDRAEAHSTPQPSSVAAAWAATPPGAPPAALRVAGAHSRTPTPPPTPSACPEPALEQSLTPSPAAKGTPLSLAETAGYDGEDLHAIYRPSDDPGADHAA